MMESNKAITTSGTEGEEESTLPNPVEIEASVSAEAPTTAGLVVMPPLLAATPSQSESESSSDRDDGPNNNASLISADETKGESTSPVVVATEVETSAEAGAEPSPPAACVTDESTNKTTPTELPPPPQVKTQPEASSEANEAERINSTREPPSIASEVSGDISFRSTPHETTSTTSGGRPPREPELWEEVSTQRVKLEALETRSVESSVSPEYHGEPREENDRGEPQEEEKQEESLQEVAGNAIDSAALAVALTVNDLHTTSHVQQVQPGAFWVYPGRSARNNIRDEDFSFPWREVSSNHYDSTTFMVEANLVVVDELVEAQPFVESKPTRLKVQLLVLAAAVIVVALVVGLSMGLTYSKQSSLNTATVASINDAFHSSLPENTKAAIEGDPTSPQYRAFAWETEMDRVPFSVQLPQDERLLRMMQRFALATLYYSTDGNNSWLDSRNWLDPILHEKGWLGVICFQDDVIHTLELSFNSLNGTLPKELSLLSTSPEILSLSGNLLMGSIPSELINFRNLTILNLGNNQLKGTLPTELGNLTNLEFLDLSSNALTGSMPSSLGDLSKLTSLFLFGNVLSEMLPPQLGDLTNLDWFSVSSNKLTGTIPSELANLSKLTQLHLDYNYMNGTLPTELGDLTNLDWMDLNSNKLIGSIPSELSRLSKLTSLSLAYNHLSGTVPTELGRLLSLVNLNLENNTLTGRIPRDLGSLQNLTTLHLHGNRLNGSVPMEICDLIAVKATPPANDYSSYIFPLDVRIDCELVQCDCASNCTCGPVFVDNNSYYVL